MATSASRPSPSMCVPEASCTRSTTREVKRTRIPAHPQQSGLALRARRPGDVLFIVTVHPPYERGHNPAFWYQGERLLPLADYAELADFDVHLPTRRIAFVYWDGEQRHLAVKELLTK